MWGRDSPCWVQEGPVRPRSEPRLPVPPSPLCHLPGGGLEATPLPVHLVSPHTTDVTRGRPSFPLPPCGLETDGAVATPPPRDCTTAALDPGVASSGCQAPPWTLHKRASGRDRTPQGGPRQLVTHSSPGSSVWPAPTTVLSPGPTRVAPRLAVSTPGATGRELLFDARCFKN